MPPVGIVFCEEVNLKRWEELLCESRELPVTLANARAVGHEVLLAELRRIARAQQAPPAVGG